MNLIQVGAAVLNQTPLDWEGNRRNIVAAIRAARAEGVTLLCLPELCVSGYGCEDAFHSVGLQRVALEVLREILPETEGMIVSLGVPLSHNNALYNMACLAVSGRVVGFTGKRFLAGDGLHYEPRWFKGWPNDRQATTTLGDATVPIGDLHYDVGGVRIGFEICEDAWVANRPGGELALKGVDILLNPSASHFAFGKSAIRRRFVLEGSRAFAVSYIYANLLGNESGRAIYDGGALIASGGELLASGPRFSYADFRLTTATIDIDRTRLSQARTASFQPRFDEQTGDRVVVPFEFPRVAPRATPPVGESWEDSPRWKEEEFARAVPLALFDYMRKSRSRGFVVSLSGGADSSAVACLVALMVEFGVRELGREGFLGKTPYWEIAPGEKPSDLVGKMLACVYQSTRNSSETTLEAARGVAEAISAEFLRFDVDRITWDYIEMVSLAIGRELSWTKDDVPLQNIQARARAPGVWLLTNLRGALLLATSNRSEAAVGYATMDGDTCGGLSPIAGIDKAFLRRWLRWRETEGPLGLGPLPALAAVNRQAPTAELRPRSAAQTDEADLMPYDVLDAVERSAIRDKQTPLEVFQRIQPEFVQYDARQLAEWVERFFRLWCRNQWKRERYAPSFHVDDENLDPKTWCRFPILSGGFERELTALWKFVNGGA